MKSNIILVLPALVSYASAYTLWFYSDNNCTNDFTDHSAPDPGEGVYGDCADIGIRAKSVAFRADGDGTLLYLSLGNDEAVGAQCVNGQQWLEPSEYLDDAQLQVGCYDTSDSQANLANTGFVQYQVGNER
ncbi:hypothetical protein M409DRAFT_48557 [Zasmidium cellare ATCC 36951]|uniref:Cyanovirin-N domain-containing protein n=1 Tax=Zasmidium cellare ATCC 36951 TaxID=1080233 RepID=A0A6A6D5W1_ZASCE|nr:uncharacterized protein M409DRAFT_48557 [Zasmidium cellare ATCC 36951]KAF2173602.1 hypothetical protein M409DRAFT_48557 [Zasmidium cellare ATCC 36951]